MNFSVRNLKLLFITVVFQLGCNANQSTSEKQENSFDIATVDNYNSRAVSFIQGDLDSLLYYAKMAGDESQKTGYAAGYAQALLHISNYHNTKGVYAPAMENALRALHIFDSLGMKSPMGDTHAQLAYIYKSMASQHRTPEYLNKGMVHCELAFDQYADAADTAGMANSLNIAGILYRDKYYAEKEGLFFDSAFVRYVKAMELITASGKGEKHLGKLYNNTSQFYNEYKNDYQQGLSWLFKAVKFNEERNNRVSLLYNYGNISGAYRQLKEYPNALYYANRMLEGAGELGQPNRKHDALYELFRTYKSQGRHEEALRYYILADAITDSLSNVEKTQLVSEIRTRYETGKKEQQIEQLNLEKVNISKRNFVLMGGITLLLLLLVTLLILYRRIQLQKKKISVQSQRLTVMMKELHHRVKNNLQIVSSLLSLQTYRSKDENTISVLRESQHRVQAMSFIHQRLYNTGDVMTVNMKEYITDLAESLVSSFGFRKDKFRLNINVETERLDVDKALPIGLMINEIITNSLKYAYDGIAYPELNISLKEENDQLMLTIGDNGTGIDTKTWDDGSNSSFGKQLIKALSRQLNAKEHIAAADGTQFTLIIPAGKAA